jgi:hypothetical protein
MTDLAGKWVPCALYEGDFHLGVAALATSLYHRGFRGVMWVGYRGPLPFWADGADLDGEVASLVVAPDFLMRFLPVPGDRHIATEKPFFIRRILDGLEPDCEGVLFFDADIVVNADWSFMRSWAAHGAALCVDCGYPAFPSGHPARHAWRREAAKLGRECRDIEWYLNAGFIGIARKDRAMVDVWAELIERWHGDNIGYRNQMLHGKDRTDPFFCIDQDLMNAAAMATDVPLSIIGQEAMDFLPYRLIMSHAVRTPKPWNKNYLLAALKGYPPTSADFAYWSNVGWPIELFGRGRLWRTRLSLRIAQAIGRFYRRTLLPGML